MIVCLVFDYEIRMQKKKHRIRWSSYRRQLNETKRKSNSKFELSRTIWWWKMLARNQSKSQLIECCRFESRKRHFFTSSSSSLPCIRFKIGTNFAHFFFLIIGTLQKMPLFSFEISKSSNLAKGENKTLWWIASQLYAEYCSYLRGTNQYWIFA